MFKYKHECHSQRKTNYETVMTQKLRVEKYFKKEVNTIYSDKNCREEGCR